jgi:hypothetical protein
MKRYVWSVALLLTVGVLGAVHTAAAQGVTSAAVVGRLTDEGGSPVEAAIVSLINTSTGQRYVVRSSGDGRYFIENAQVGGPYTIEVRAVGFEQARTENITLRLGQRLEQNFSLRRTAVQVAGITVQATADSIISASRTGAQTFVSNTAIENLPSLGRNFTDFIQIVPQVVTANVPGATLGGQNNRFNNIQIDGGVNNDVFGLAASGTPGGQANAHPISIEAVREYQVLIAPYDVRQGSFTGGLINAVTKSGSNEFHGSAWGYLQNQGFVGKDTAGNKPADFTQSQYGLSFSGPIIRDKLQFFASADLQHRVAPFVGQLINADTAGGVDSIGVGIRQSRADSVTTILQNVYGFNPGTYAAPDIGNPDKNIFAKVTAQLGTNHALELSHNFVDANQDNLIHNSTATGFRDGYQLSSSGYMFSTKTNTTRAKLTSTISNRYSNELLLGWQRIRDIRDLANSVPLIFVAGNRPGTNIAAGADRFSQGNQLNQDIYELTDNFTFAKGSHLVTVGTHNEFFHFFNVFFPGSYGVWGFASPESLAVGNANHYEIALPLRPGGPTADFHVKQFGFYAQDQVTPKPGLTITGGLRVDIPSLDKPVQNDSLAASPLGVNTGDFPSGNLLWSPRLGFNWDLRNDQTTQVRGGIGIFSGRPPYVWISNAYGNTGREQVLLVCTGASVPTFTPGFVTDPSSQPTQCTAGGPPTPPAASVVFYDPNFKFPQNLKLSLGVDRKLGWGVVGTLDFLFTKSINQFYIMDVNLQGIQSTLSGEGGRAVYGATGGASVSPLRVTSSFRDVLRHENRSQDRSISIAAQAQKRFSNSLEFNVSYAYSHTEDLFSMTSSIASSNYRFTALDGTVANRNLRTSVFDIPHKITASATVHTKFDFLVSLIYVGQSGSPFTYAVSNDINGDGFGGNDIVYVPRDSADMTMTNPADWATLNSYINSEPCLSSNRGRLLPRNSCRNPWTNFLNASVAKVVPTVGGQSIEIRADVFNVLNLINGDWGLIRSTSGFEEANLLRQTGFDTVNQRGIYSLSLPQRNRVQTNSSLWRLQLGLKYLF